MNEEPRPKSDITEELSKLGNQVAEALRAAWESEDRRRLQAEVTEGLQKFGDQVEGTVKRASDTDAARRMREQAETVANKAAQSDVVAEVREGLLNGLQALNKELSRLLTRLDNPQAGAPESPVPPVAPQPPSDDINPT